MATKAQISDSEKEALVKLTGFGAIVDAMPADLLIANLHSGKKLTVYLGIDPTSPDLHLGHTVPIGLLNAFAKMGHKTILLIGDFTATIGDPTGRDKQRQVLGDLQVKDNVSQIVNQLKNVLDINQTEIVYNSAWHGRESKKDFFAHAYHLTAGQLWERDLFREREKKGQPVSLAEFLYPYLQGYDAVKLKADIQIGSSDQLFNMMVGRDLCKKMEDREHFVITTPLISGSDGQKMSKSYGNIIPLSSTPADMYGKIMSMPDSSIGEYSQALLPIDKISKIEDLVKASKMMDAKSMLALEIVKKMKGEQEATKAQTLFNETFRQNKVPKDIPDCWCKQSGSIVSIMRLCNLAESSSVAKRLVGQGGVRIDGEVITDENLIIHPKDQILQVGKKMFVKLRREHGR